jgi:hypothetical protein
MRALLDDDATNAAGVYKRNVSASFQMDLTRSPTGTGRAIAADCPAHTCIRWKSPADAPARFIAEVNPLCTG